jgi:AAA domain
MSAREDDLVRSIYRKAGLDPDGKAKDAASKPISAAELLGTELPPVKWAVPDVLPEGVTILGGKPKMGKSWLALGLGVSIAAGGKAIGKIPTEQGGALYLGLEDNKRRLQRRLKKILAGRTAPQGLEVYWEWPQLDKGGVEALRAYLRRRPNTRLVVIDTLKKIRPRTGGNRSVYDLDYEALEPLLPLAAECGVAILVVHHLRKLEAGDPLDMISGSTGLTGGVDGALILKRDRGKQDATLVIDGRDIEVPSELALRWDADIASWLLMGEAEEYRISEERRGVVELLRRVGEPMGPKEIADALEANYGSLRVILPEMVREGLVNSPTRGKYVAINNVNNVNNADNTNNVNGAQSRPVVNGADSAVNNAQRETRTGKRDTAVVKDVNAAKSDNDMPAAAKAPAREAREGKNSNISSNLSLSAGGSMIGEADREHVVGAGWFGPPRTAEQSPRVVGDLLADPPQWLAKQLVFCRQNPEGYLEPTARAIAKLSFDEPERWEEVVPVLQAQVGTDYDPRKRGEDVMIF